MPILRAFNRRLLRPWANEARRFLAGQLRLPLTITVDRLGEFRFRVQNTTELGRTLDYGHEMGSLAAFLFITSYGYRLLCTRKCAEQYHLIAGATS